MTHEAETDEIFEFSERLRSKPSNSDFVLRCLTSKLQCIQQ